MDPWIRFVGPTRALEVFGVKLVGLNAENGKKLLLSIALLLLVLAVSRALHWVAARDPAMWVRKSRDVHDIAYWMLDDDYDGSNFVVRQVFFCGGDKDEFDDWKKELSTLAATAAKKKAEQLLKIEIDYGAFANAYGHVSRPFSIKPGQKVAVRVISQFGEETTKVLAVKNA